MATTGMRGERIAAWTAVAAVHVVLVMLLLQVPAPPERHSAAATALDVVWIATPRPPSARTARSGHEQRMRKTAPLVVPVPEPDGLQGNGSKPLSAVFIEQARLPVPEAERAFAADPFADRVVRLPGRDARTFRMRPPPSLAERVAAVGRMFGGGDDPCRSARDSINELSQAGDSRVLQDALDYEKRFCR